MITFIMFASLPGQIQLDGQGKKFYPFLFIYVVIYFWELSAFNFCQEYLYSV